MGGPIEQAFVVGLEPTPVNGAESFPAHTELRQTALDA